jgi:radical SAM protein with 4Fe4S-binding SPASM domain
MTITGSNSNEKYICQNLEIESLSEIKEFPLYIQIETLAKCNSRCIMCPRSRNAPVRQTLEMTDTIFEKIVGELKNHTDFVRRVTPQGYGEPVLDKKLPSRIKRLKAIGIREVFISTNASLMNEERSRAFLESGLDQIDFSVDAVTKETYERIRKGINYDVVVHNIQNFIKIRNKIKAKTKIRFRYVIQSENEHEYDDFCSFWKKHIDKDDIISGKKIHTFGGHIEMPGSSEYQSLQRRMKELPCKGVFGSLFIYCDGQVPICGVDVNQDYIAGDVRSSSLKEIWQGKLFSEFRSGHLKSGRSSYDHCPSCNSWATELKMPNAS